MDRAKNDAPGVPLYVQRETLMLYRRCMRDPAMRDKINKKADELRNKGTA